MKVVIKDNALIPDLPNPLITSTGPMYGANESDYAAHGYYTVDAPTCDRKHWVIENNSIREMTQDEKVNLATQEAQAEEQALSDRIAAITPELWQTAAAFRMVYRRHFGVGAETNRSITRQSVMDYFAAKAVQGTATAQDALDLRLLEAGFEAITAWTGTDEIWSFPWAMLPEVQP